MATEDDTDLNDWAPGQPPPWLAAYGSPPEPSADPYFDPSANTTAFAQGRPDMPAPADSTNPVTGSGAFVQPTPTEPNPGYAEYDSAGNRASPLASMGAASAGLGSTSGVALIGQSAAPIGTIGQIGQAQGPTTGAELPTLGRALPTFTPDELARVGQAPTIEMPDDYVGRTTPQQIAAAFVPPWLAGPPQHPAGAPMPATDVGAAAIPKPGDQTQGETPEQALARITLDPNTPVAKRQEAFFNLPPQAQANIIATADPEQLAAIASDQMSPEDLAKIQGRYQTAILHKQSAQQLELAYQRDEQARRDYETLQTVYQEANANTAQLDQEAKAIAQEKIDPNEHGVGHFIASVLTSALGGSMSQYTGGRNLALEELDRRTAARIDAQKADIENRWKGVGFRRNLIAEHVQRSGDMYRAAMAYHLAQYDRAEAELQIKQQDYAAGGTTDLRIAQERQQIRDRRIAALQAYNKSQIEDGLKQAQTQQALASAAKTQQETVGLKFKQAGVGSAKPIKFEDQPRTLDELRGMGVAIPSNVQLPQGAGLSLNQARKLAETGGSAEEWNKKTRENSPADLNRQLGIGEIVDEQGKPVQFRDPQFAGTLANTKASVDTAVGLVDELIRLRNQNGWTSDTVKSPAWQKTQSALSALLLKAKESDHLGVLSGSDLDLEMKKLGGLDPTGMRDPIPGLLGARDHMLQDLNAQIRAQAANGQKPKPYAPPNMYTVDAAKPLVGGKTSVEQGEGAKLGFVGQRLSFTTNDERAQKAENAANVGSTGLDAGDDKNVMAAIAAAKGTGAGADDAVQRLADAAQSNREAVRNAVLSRVRGEAPDVYARVVERLPARQQADLREIEVHELPPGEPTFQFAGGSPEQLAAAVATDHQLADVVAKKALHGTPEERKKAIEVITMAHARGAK